MPPHSAAVPSLLQSEFIREYGMVFVLLLLVVLFSVVKIDEQHPTGADAGRKVAERILRQHGESPAVLIVTGDTDDDVAFAEAARQHLQAGGARVLADVNGEPADARRALESLRRGQKYIDAIAATNVTRKWTVYEAFPEAADDKFVTPRPYYWPNFLKVSNLLSVANQTAIYAIVAIGMTMVIITAGIDLSVGSLIALASVSTAVFLRDYGGGKEAPLLMLVVGCAIGIGVCALSGAFVGTMVTSFRIPPFIVTLAMMLVASGLALRMAEGKSIDAMPDAMKWLGGRSTLGLPNSVWLMAALYGIAHVVMSRTVFGRHIYAIGGNEQAARLSGIRVKGVLIAVYTISGALAGLGGVVLTSRLGAANPTYGTMAELEVIAAVVVGGASLMGGQGRIFGTLIGAFIIAVIKNGMNMTNVDPFNQKIVLGAVLLAAVLLDTLKRRDAS